MSRSTFTKHTLVCIAGIIVFMHLNCNNEDNGTGPTSAGTSATVSGSVTTILDQPLPDVIFLIFRSGASDYSKPCTTNSFGTYVTEKLAAGTYTISPYRYGYSFSPQDSVITVTETDLTDVDFVANIDNTYVDKPVITRLLPLEMTDFMVIEGSFGFDSAHTTVTVEGVTQSIVEFSHSRIKCTLPVSGPGSHGDVIVSTFGKASDPVELTSWRGTICYSIFGPKNILISDTILPNDTIFDKDIILPTDTTLAQLWKFNIHMRGDIHDKSKDCYILFCLDCEGQVTYQGSYNDGDWKASWNGFAPLTHTLRAENPLVASYYGEAKIFANDSTHLWFDIKAYDDTNTEQMWESGNYGWVDRGTGKRAYMVPTKDLIQSGEVLSTAKMIREPADISSSGVIGAHKIEPVDAYIINRHLTDWKYTEEMYWSDITPEL